MNINGVMTLPASKGNIAAFNYFRVENNPNVQVVKKTELDFQPVCYFHNIAQSLPLKLRKYKCLKRQNRACLVYTRRQNRLFRSTTSKSQEITAQDGRTSAQPSIVHAVR